MDIQNPKKYTILENILQKINQKYIALPADEKKRNNQLLSVVSMIVSKIRKTSLLFDNLFQNFFYGGSYYDNLKVGKPSEYDLDCLLCLPKIIQPTVEVSDKPGYIHIKLKDLKSLEKSPEQALKYVGLEKLLDGDYLSARKVKSWMESLMSSIITENSNMIVSVDNTEISVKPKVCKSGPALTIKLEGVLEDKQFSIDVDLVPCFTFSGDQWPANYRPNPYPDKNAFFAVPKSPTEVDANYWRLSFQEQEKELISGSAIMKPAIRLIKKIRDRYNHIIASYYIKTVFLWELEINYKDEDLLKKPLSFVFMLMLTKYADYLSRKEIPYYWNKEYNLIGHLPDVATSCIANKIRNVIEQIERACATDPYSIVECFLFPSEFDVETFKQEVPLSKKHLKQLTCVSPTHITENLSQLPDIEELTGSVPSLLTQSNFDVMSKLEMLCSEQKKVSELLSCVLERLESCEGQIKELRSELVVARRNDDEERGKMFALVQAQQEKLDLRTLYL